MFQKLGKPGFSEKVIFSQGPNRDNDEQHSRQKEKEVQFALNVFSTCCVQGTMRSPVPRTGE